MNTFNFTGRLTKDVATGTTTVGDYAKLSVAVNVNKTTTIFVNCVAYDKTADYVIKYGKKGMMIGISGRVDGIYKDNISVTVNTADIILPPKDKA